MKEDVNVMAWLSVTAVSLSLLLLAIVGIITIFVTMFALAGKGHDKAKEVYHTRNQRGRQKGRSHK